MSVILGISAYYHDSAAAIIKNGKIIAAAQEERFTRKKHDASFPINAIKYVLSEMDINLNDVDSVAFYDKPFLKFERLLETYTALAPKGMRSYMMAMPIWLREKLFLKNVIFEELKSFENQFKKEKIYFSEHHLSHAASAFYPSPFEKAVVLTLDGVGEWATTSVAIGNKEKLEILKEIHFPHSIGLLYSAFTFYLGFKVNSGEYKVMGLAPYGIPKYKDIILNEIVDLKKDGSFRLNQKYFNYATGLEMTNSKFDRLFEHPVRKKESKLTQFHMDIAASIQSVIEEILDKIINSLSKEHQIDNLCLAGGVALNCVANGKILRKRYFKNIWIQPAAGDAGGSIGAALALWHIEFRNSRINDGKDQMKGSYLGPSFDQNICEKKLNTCNAKFNVYKKEEILEKTIEALLKDKVIGWFQGRMEFGPRALGGRSIIANPQSTDMQKKLNLKIKYRESFRPFAPAILSEKLSSWFDLNTHSPYMLLVGNVKAEKRLKIKVEDEKEFFGIDKLNLNRSLIPAVTHVDNSARIQTVHKETNPRFYDLIDEFYKKSNCPILVNTSFNVRGEPIVCDPIDAFKCFMGTEMDILVIENCFLIKEEQDKSHYNSNYLDNYELD